MYILLKSADVVNLCHEKYHQQKHGVITGNADPYGGAALIMHNCVIYFRYSLEIV